MPRNDPARLGLKVTDWVESDQRAWQYALHYRDDEDFPNTSGSLTHLEPVSIRALERSYGLWCAWLKHHQIFDLSDGPAEAVTLENVRRYATKCLATQALFTVVSRISQLYSAVKAIAPEQDWLWLRNIWYRLRLRARSMRDKRERVEPAETLYACGIDEMESAESDAAGTPRARAVCFRNGLIVALLALRPIRIKNMAAMQIGRNFVLRGNSYCIQFDDTETKTHHPYEALVPTKFNIYLKRYLEYHRPLLARAGRHNRCESMWLTTHGAPLQHNMVYRCVTRLTYKRLGRAINPHAFRVAAATSIAQDDPEHVRITKNILGHASITTSEASYNMAEGHRIAKHHQDLVFALRSEARSASRGDT